MPDYSKQLDEIVKALNRPATPQWQIALFSALLGLVVGVVGPSLMDFRRRDQMRRVLYLDLIDMFWAVKNIMAVTDIPESDRQRWQREQLKKVLLFRGEKYCVDNLEIYRRLPERRVGEMLYPYFHQIVGDEKGLRANTSLALMLSPTSFMTRP
jgi:hypothetical protein